MSEQRNVRVNTESVLPIPPACPGGQIYTVRAGDTMFLIAQRFGICLQSLIAANPQIVDPNMIMVGQRICVPFPLKPPECQGEKYTVVSGDTLFNIARRFGVSLEELIRANPQIIDPDKIFPGQVICIPQAPAPCPTGFTYTVMAGDTLFGIAKRLGVSLETLLRLNPQITDPDRLVVGQVICVPLPVPPAICSGQYYIVQSGDTLSAIANRYKLSVREIMEANPQITDANRIYVGQVICLPRRMTAPIPLPTPVPSPGPCPPMMPMPAPSPEPCPPMMPMPAPGPEPCPPMMPMPAPGPGPCPPMMPMPAPGPEPCPPMMPTPVLSPAPMPLPELFPCPPMTPAPGSIPSPPISPLPYPCAGPIFYVPPVRWEDCPFAPRQRYRPRRLFRRRR